MTTIGEIVSRVKTLVKAYKPDAFITDRFIYSLCLKHGKWLLKREDGGNKLMRISSIFTPVIFELEDVDKVDANCVGLTADCTIKRTTEKLPQLLEGYYGPLIRYVTSIDKSKEVVPTSPTAYINISKQKNFRYNKTKYYWLHDGYLFFPDFSWEAVHVELLVEDPVEMQTCNCDKDCLPRQAQPFNIPDYLHGEIESNVIKEMFPSLQIPSDNNDDKQNILR